jgi:hypothetical protein
MSRPEVVKGVCGHDEACEVMGLAWVRTPKMERRRRGMCIVRAVVQY